jgi:transcriptional regulator PpsR
LESLGGTRSGLLLKKFKAAKKLLGNLDAEVAGELLAAAADIVLIIDKKGVIRDVAFGSDDLCVDIKGEWLGRAWPDTVTIESRPTAAAILQDAGSKAERRWREVSHPAVRGANVPVLYCAIQVGPERRVVAMGRDLRVIETLQQRLMNIERTMEKEFSRLRHAETRHQLLFQNASEAVLVIESSTSKVTEANSAAQQILGASGRCLVGRSFPEGFDERGAREIDALLAAARTNGRGDEVRASLSVSGRELAVAASLFHQHDVPHLLVRLRPLRGESNGAEATPAQSRLLAVLEGSPDGLVVTSLDGRILTANRAFLELAQLATAAQARGQPLDRWLGRQGSDTRILIGNLREHGSVRLFASTVRGEYGSRCAVEVSAVSAASDQQPCLGFTVRNVEKRAATDTRTTRELPRSADELTELIGRVPLKELVRETTDVIERLCIEAALKLTGDNRATAAQMLGLSRQSLYAKLRRFRLGNLGADET